MLRWEFIQTVFTEISLLRSYGEVVVAIGGGYVITIMRLIILLYNITYKLNDIQFISIIITLL